MLEYPDSIRHHSQMKAVTFLKPFEYTLKIDGESWPQGAQVTGTLEVKNHSSPGSSGSDLADARVLLAITRGDLKKVHAKTPGALSVVKLLSPPPSDPNAWQLPAGGETKTFPWETILDRNCPITDSVGSPFLAYGHSGDLDSSARIQLPVTSEPILAAFLNACNVHFRFIIKSQRWSKSGTTATKLVPPDSKRFARLEYITLTSHFSGEELELNYEFNEKSKKKRELDQTLSPAEYRLPSGRLNTDVFERKLEEALQAHEGSAT
ncbi:MAG: hypothetical protein H7301_11820 [Cryobacterium sp.]|nr:hypothetical protein [Oligoflexia bacterium]